MSGARFHPSQRTLASYLARRGASGNAKPQGQALTEFLVVALVLVPLFLLMPVIAKYQDIAHATQTASRYAAFEAMTRNDGVSTWKPVDQLAGEVRRRFFSNSDAAIKTNDTAGNFNAHRNLFWVDPKGESLIADFDNDVKITFGPGNSVDHAGGFSAASDGKPFNSDLSRGVPFNVSQELGLQTRGIYTTNISVALLNLPGGIKSYEPFDQINLSINRHTSLALDAWGAANPGQVESRINQQLLFPGSLLKSVNPLADAAVGIVESPKYFPALCSHCGPKLGELEFWRDVVPEDRRN